MTSLHGQSTKGYRVKASGVALLFSVVFVSACTNSKLPIGADSPVPQSASLHRLPVESLSDTAFTSEEAFIPAVDVASLRANTSDKTKFSSKLFGVKGSPRMTDKRSVRKGGGRYKLGKPYTIRGKKYYPREDPNYKKSGLASWYGPNFHGRLTANGEIYDQYALSAAHPTMPLPSYAKVTNLENGSSVTVRVNDRGPYAHNRVIDLSSRAAQMLGYEKQGVAKVKVEYVGRAPLHGLDEKQLVATYNPGRLDPSTIPPLLGVGNNNVVLAQSEGIRRGVAANQIEAFTEVGFAPPVPAFRPLNNVSDNGLTIPRPSTLVNSFVAEDSAVTKAPFDLIAPNMKLSAPKIGMKDLIQIQFGPFANSGELETAELLLADAGILQRISDNASNAQMLLLIVAQEDITNILEMAKTAGINRSIVR